MADASTPSVADRLVQVLDHLGVSRAHFLLRAPQDILDLLATAPDRVASVVVQGGSGRPADLAMLGARALWLLGDEGEPGSSIAHQAAGRPGLNVHWLKGYTEYMWSDTVADRTAEVSQAILDFLPSMERDSNLPQLTLTGEGEVAEVTYRAAGSGTPIVLLPLGLSAHQWDPLVPTLQAGHCTINLGGKHLQPVENLESRAAGDYSRMALQFLELAAPQANELLIEAGCGSGALLRRIARQTPIERVVGLDINSFLLREARALAAFEGLAESLTFREGSAEAIPFPDETFDIAFSSTVMEEVNANQMVAEMVRITRAGGRVVVIVRAVDRGGWTNLPLPKDLKEKVESASGGVGARGCADESLCRRFHEAGLRDIRGGPSWAWIRPGDAWWKNQVQMIRRRLTPDESEEWNRALTAAREEDFPVWVARPFHCAIGTK